MFIRKCLALAAAILCLSALPAGAMELEEGAVGAWLTRVPEDGRLMLDSRVLRCGDVLTADQASRVVFLSDSAEDAPVEYLPIFSGRIGQASTTRLIGGSRNNRPPVAEDSALETYKNLPNTARFRCTDPDSEELTFTIVRPPRRGTVEIAADGSFTYTPKKNKVGADSFTYTAADPRGGVSREATVTVTILKPTDAAQYTDTQGRSCRFAAEWMRHTGIFEGEQVTGVHCFAPDAQVTRGEFMVMAVRALEIPVDEAVVYSGFEDAVPDWQQPYLAAAARAGLTARLDNPRIFAAEQVMTLQEARQVLGLAAVPAPGLDTAVLSQTAEDTQVLSAEGAVVSAEAVTEEAAAVSAEAAAQATAVPAAYTAPLTRAAAAEMLYEVTHN